MFRWKDDSCLKAQNICTPIFDSVTRDYYTQWDICIKQTKDRTELLHRLDDKNETIKGLEIKLGKTPGGKEVVDILEKYK